MQNAMSQSLLRNDADTVRSSLVRNHNERLILSLLKSEGPMSGANIARRCQFSAQTASVITRLLESDGLLVRGTPVKGKVGKPSVPVELSPDGAFAFGLRIGRRGAELVLMDLVGAVRGSETLRYDFPTPSSIDRFVEEAADRLMKNVPKARRDKVIGFGVGAPNQLWDWLDILGAPVEQMQAWRDHAFEDAFARFSDLPVMVANDGTMACNGERVSGLGQQLANFAYFYVGSFVGGGLVLNRKLYDGPNGNAGAMGSMPSGTVHRGQLIQEASIYTLEQHLAERTGTRVSMWGDTDAWSKHSEMVDDWIKESALALAKAVASVACILDVQDIVIDGGYPREVAHKMVEQVNAALDDVNTQGILPMRVVCGTLGSSAGALGAAFQPIMAAHYLDGSQITAV